MTGTIFSGAAGFEAAVLAIVDSEGEASAIVDSEDVVSETADLEEDFPAVADSGHAVDLEAAVGLDTGRSAAVAAALLAAADLVPAADSDMGQWAAGSTAVAGFTVEADSTAAVGFTVEADFTAAEDFMVAEATVEAAADR